MVSRVAIAFLVGHHELLLVALFPGRSNDNANATLKNFVVEMLSRIVLERCVILEFLGPLLTRPGSPRRLSVTLASRCDRLREGSKASTEWSVAKHDRNLTDLLYQILVDFYFGTQGNTAAQIMSI
jgi:hypothetical protein